MDNDTNDNRCHEDGHNTHHCFKRLSLGTQDNETYIICLIGFKDSNNQKIESSDLGAPTTELLSDILPHLIPEALVFESPSFRTRELDHLTIHSASGLEKDEPASKGIETGTTEQTDKKHLKSPDSSESAITLQSNSIQIEALRLLESLRTQFCSPGQPWERLVLAGYGIWGIIIKQVFFATPHQIDNLETWETVLLSIIQTCKFKTGGRISDVLSGLSVAAAQVYSTFYDLLRKYRSINVIEGKGVAENELPLVGELGSFGDETEFHHVEWRKEQSLTTILRFDKHSLRDLELLRTIFVPQDPSIVEGDTANGIRTTFRRGETSYNLYLQFLQVLSPSRWLIWEAQPFSLTHIDLKGIYGELLTTLEEYDWKTNATNSEIQIIGPKNYGKSHLLKHVCQQVRRLTTRVVIQYLHEPNRGIDVSDYGLLVVLLHQLVSQRPDLFISIEDMVKEYLLWGTWTEKNLWALLSVLITRCPYKIQFAIAVDFKQFKEKEDVVRVWISRLGAFFEQHSTNYLYILSSKGIITTDNTTSSSSRVVLDVGSKVPSKSQDRFAELALELAIKNSPRFKFLEDKRHSEIRLALATKIRSLGVSFAGPGSYARILSSYTPQLLTPSTFIDAINTGPLSLAELSRRQVQKFKEGAEPVANWWGLGISWALKGFRPLRLEEFAIAVAIDLTDNSFESLDGRISRDLESDLNQHAGLFLKVENGRVYSVFSKSELEQILEEVGPDQSVNHAQLTRLCLRYLKMVLSRPEAGQEWEDCLICLSSPWQHPNSAIYNSSSKNMEFLDYTVRNWVEHYRQADVLDITNDIHLEVREFLENSLLRDRWLQAYHSAESRRRPVVDTLTSPYDVNVTDLSKDIEITTALEVAEYFGLSSLIGILRKDAAKTADSTYEIQIKSGYRVRNQSFTDSTTEEFIRALICNGETTQVKDFIRTKQPTEAKLLAPAVYLSVQSGRLELLELLARAECSSKVISESESYVTLPKPNILRAGIFSGSSSTVEYILKFEDVRNYVTSLTPVDWELEPLLKLELDIVSILSPIKEIMGSNIPIFKSKVPGRSHHSSLRGSYFIKRLLGLNSTKIDSEHRPTMHRLAGLHFSIRSESFEFIQFVLNSGPQGDKRLTLINGIDYSGWTALHIAAALGRANVVEELLKFGANVNVYTQNPKKETPAEIAVKNGHLHVLRHLLPQSDEDRISLLQLAAKAGQLLMVEYLLGLQGDQSDPDVQNLYKTALIEAAKCGHSEIVRVLLSAKVDPNGEVGERRTALHYAAQGGHPEVAKILIDHGANIDSPDSTRNNPLHLAAMHGGFDVAKILIEHKADVNAQNRGKSMPLHLTNHPEIITLLLDSGADIDARDSRGRSPLVAACIVETQKPRVVELLLEANVDISATDFMGNSALHYAIKNNHFDIVRLICENDRYAQEFQKTLLGSFSWAFEFSRISMVEYFLERALDLGIDVTDLRDISERTILHIAVKSPEFPRLFSEWEPKIKWSRIIDVPDDDGCTPLYDSACYTKIETVRFLLEKGANMSIATENGWTPLHTAYDSEEISELLISNNADINPLTNSRLTPLMIACQYGYPLTAKLLLRNHAEIELEDASGNTALHLSVSNDQYETTKLLLGDWGDPADLTSHPIADVGKRNHRGYTPLHVAIKLNYSPLVKLLLQKGSDKRAKTDLDETCLDLAMLPTDNPDGEIFTLLLSKDGNDSPPIWTSEEVGLLLAKHFRGGLDRRIFAILEAEPSLLTSGVLDPLLLGLMHANQEFEEAQENIAIELLYKGFDPFKIRAGSKLSVFQSAFIVRERVRQKFIDACMAKLPQNIKDCGNGFGELRTAIEYRDRALWRQFSSLLDSASEVRDEDGWTIDHFIYQSQILDSQPLVKSERVPEAATLTPKALILPEVWKRWNRRSDLNVNDRFEISDTGLVVTFTDGNRRDDEDNPTYLSCSLRADHPFPPRATETSYFEVEIQSIDPESGPSDSSTVLIGLCGEFAFLGNAAPGWNRWTVGYHGDDGGMFEENGTSSRRLGNKFGIGNTVGCGVDYELGDYYFTLDGKIEARSKAENQYFISRKLYPVVGQYGSACKVLVNFGQKPFKWTGLENTQKRQLERRPTFAKATK
ncbi:hypothetical protein TWF506_004145 [Arthrobotrys conoides]|uniref:B30.2/SPRY domain-containing protein n=1 Tax=Arthrobotrys conoides TaxID=74498 RepID=A0AAN8N395_9PEZI